MNEYDVTWIADGYTQSNTDIVLAGDIVEAFYRLTFDMRERHNIEVQIIAIRRV